MLIILITSILITRIMGNKHVHGPSKRSHNRFFGVKGASMQFSLLGEEALAFLFKLKAIQRKHLKGEDAAA